MTGAQIRAALNSRLTKTEAVNGVNDEINAALQHIAGMANWPDLHKTDSSTLTFAATNKSKDLPSDFKEEDRLYIADDRTLVPGQVRVYQELENAGSGEPSEYEIIGGSVYLYPIPDASTIVYLDYWHDPATVTDETAALVLGNEFKEAVINWTIVAYLKTNGLNSHPKLAENAGLFQIEMDTLLQREDRKPVVAKPFRYA